MTTDLIFDFFGTLVQYTPGAFNSQPHHQTHDYLTSCGFPIEYDTFIAQFTRLFLQFEQRAHETLDEFHLHDVGRAFFRETFDYAVEQPVLEEFIRRYAYNWNAGTVFFAEIEPFIQQLAKHYRLSIISNTHYPALIEHNLTAMQIRPYFTEVVTSAEFGKRKPDRSIFDHTLQRLAADPSHVIYIGDTYEDDYLGAANAQIRCILIDTHSRYGNLADSLVARLFDIQTHL